MRLVWMVPLVLAACGEVDDGAAKGTYAISWKLSQTGATPTCTTHRIDDIIATATDTTSGNTVTVTAACSANTVMLEAPVGNHRVKLEAIGAFDDIAGMIETTAAINEAGMVVTLPEANVPVLPATSSANPRITIQRLGQPSSCGATSAMGLSIQIAPMGGVQTEDIFDCGTGPFVIDVVYGPYTIKADLLGAGDVVIGSSPVVNVPATRGSATPDVVVSAN